MKRFLFGHVEINISQSALERGVKACISSNCITRKTVSAIAGINESYAGKIIGAMEECKIMTKLSSVTPQSYTLSSNIYTMVLDLSMNRLSLSITDVYGDCLFHSVTDSLPDLTFSDNIYSFLSRSGIKIKEKSLAISSICVLCNDICKVDKQLISGIFADVFGLIPILYVDLHEAGAAIFDYKLVPTEQDQSTAYIRLSDEITALYYNTNGENILCDTSKLLYENNVSLNSLYSKTYSSAEAGKITSRVMTAMDFFGKSNTYVIESDRFRIDPSFTESIRHTYETTGHYLPEIFSSSLTPGYLILAASKLATSKLILSLIKAK